jgi:hypothetical protein
MLSQLRKRLSDAVLAAFCQPQRRPRAAERRCRPLLEALEDRVVPTAFTVDAPETPVPAP